MNWVHVRLVTCCTFAISLLIASHEVQAQPTTVHRLGLLSPASPSSFATRLEAFRQGLRDLGYREGQNFSIEYRWAEGNDERLSALAAELLNLKVAIILIHGVQAAQAVRKLSETVPMVCVNCGEVVSTGLVKSLARPGINLTGVTSINPATVGKRLELLKELVPGITRVALIWNSRNPVSIPEVKESEAAARLLGIQVQSLGVSSSGDLRGAFSAMSKENAQGLVIVSDATFFAWRKEFAELALTHRIPTVAWAPEFVVAGLLVGYGPDATAMARRAASFADKILRGANPAELPMEQPTTFEFVLNQKTAGTIGLTVPQSLLFRATRVIE
jgi:putative tryptophan/tyrosine transport system substrate-binding protein